MLCLRIYKQLKIYFIKPHSLSSKSVKVHQEYSFFTWDSTFICEIDLEYRITNTLLYLNFSKFNSQK